MTRVYRSPGSGLLLGVSDVGSGADLSTLAALYARPDSGLGTDVSHLNTGSGLPIGGDPALRGAKAFTLQFTVQIASGGTVADVHAKRDAGGNGGIVRITSNVTGTLVMNQPNQLWQIAPGVTITGRIDFQASGTICEGGTVTGGYYAPRSPKAHNFTIRNFAASIGSFGNNIIAFEGDHNNVLISQFDLTNPGSDFIRSWYDNDAAGDANPDGMRIEHGNLIRNAGWGTRASHGFGAQGPSAMSGNDGNNSNQQKNFDAYNLYIDNGTAAQGGMGIEWWNHESAGTVSGKGGMVRYCDIRGGQDHLLSMVRSRDNFINRNRFTIRGSGAFSCYEASGQGGADPHLRGEFSDNIIVSLSPVSGALIYYNNGPRDMIVQYNKVDGAAWIIAGGGPQTGGNFLVQQNLMVGGSVGVAEGSSYASPNTYINNGPGGAGPRP